MNSNFRVWSGKTNHNIDNFSTSTLWNNGDEYSWRQIDKKIRNYMDVGVFRGTFAGTFSHHMFVVVAESSNGVNDATFEAMGTGLSPQVGWNPGGRDVNDRGWQWYNRWASGW